MRRRTTVASLTCALLAVALGLAACAEPGRPDAEAPIVIAEIVDKTGPAKDFNDAANPGYDMAVEDINKAGGIGGRRLEVVQLDAASQPNRAPLVLRDATRSGAVAVLGPYSSNAAFAAAPLAEQLTVPIVLPTSSAAWKGEFNGFTFRLTPTLEKVVPEFVEHVLTALQVTRVGAVVDQANEASVTEVRQLAEALPAGVALEPAPQAFQTGDTDFTAQVSNVLAADPDVVWIGAQATEASLLMKQFRSRGFTGRFISSSTLNNPALYEQSGGAADGLITFQPVQDYDPAGPNSIVTSMRERLGRAPTGTMLQAYSAVQVLADALARAADPGSGASVAEALGETRGFASLMGPISWNGSGDNQHTFFTPLELTATGFAVWKPGV